jgi:hypothetical protein
VGQYRRRGAARAATFRLANIRIDTAPPSRMDCGQPLPGLLGEDLRQEYSATVERNAGPIKYDPPLVTTGEPTSPTVQPSPGDIPLRGPGALSTAGDERWVHSFLIS